MLEAASLGRIVPAAAAFVLGVCVGSFLNVVICRVPRGLSIVRPASECPSCHHRIAAWWNVPIVSWLLLRGKCHYCRAPISPRYLAVELLTGGLAVSCLWRFGFTPVALSLFSLLAALVAVALIDWEFMIIPDSLSLGFLGLGLVLSPFTGPGLLPALLGAVGAGGLLLAMGVLWQKTKGVAGMGGGDVKLMAAVGAFLGPVPGLLVIFVGALLGSIYGLLVLRKGGQTKVAFGTFLSLAAAIVIFFGHALIGWYLGAIRLGT